MHTSVDPVGRKRICDVDYRHVWACRVKNILNSRADSGVLKVESKDDSSQQEKKELSHVYKIFQNLTSIIDSLLLRL